MRVSLTVQSGPATGTTVQVEQGVMFRVGRLPQADLMIREDRALSGLHFALLCDSKRCRVRDLNSTNGTLVNKVPVNLVELSSGDQILAGNTQFKVKLEGAITDTVTDPQVYPELRQLQEEQNLHSDPMREDIADQVVPPELEGSWEGTDFYPPNLADLATSLQSRENPTAAAADENSEPMTERLPASLESEEDAAGSNEPDDDRIHRMDVVFKDQTGIRRIWLEPGQTVIFGRTQMADVTVVGDSLISQAHFALDCGERECRIRDLHSQNGVLLNQVPVPYARVYDGDTIFAGETTFLVAMTGGKPAPDQGVRSWVFEDLVRRKFATFSTIPMESGLVRYEAEGHEPTPLEFMRRLFRSRVFCAVIDPTRIGRLSNFPPHGQRHYLIDWLPEEMIEATSPVVYLLDDLELHLPFLCEIWGKDGSVMMLPAEEDNDPLESLRRIMRGEVIPGQENNIPATDVMSFYWPSILAKLVAKASLPLAARILDNCELLFVEGRDSASWRIYAPDDFARQLRQFGYRQAGISFGNTSSPPSAEPDPV